MDSEERYALRKVGRTMTVVLNNVGIQRFFQRVVLEDMRKRGQRVESLARANANSIFDTQMFLDYMQVVAVMAAEPYVKVGTTRTKDGFSYPAYWDQHPEKLKARPSNRRWLTDALRDGFNS